MAADFLHRELKMGSYVRKKEQAMDWGWQLEDSDEELDSNLRKKTARFAEYGGERNG